MFTTEVLLFIYDTVVVNLGHFSLLMINFINVFFELIVNYERERKFFFAQN
jgi:putative flippase GtrA